MIVVEAVRPTARELRPITSGWGAIHWLNVLPLYVGFLGFLIFGLVAMGPDGDAYPPGLLFVFFVGTTVAWWASYRLAVWGNAKALRMAPAGSMDWRWTISEGGLRFESALQTVWTDWKAIKSVQEEKDRFVFLLLPTQSPVLSKRLLTEEQASTLRTLVDDLDRRGVLGAGVD
ncbi:YcxB family protein [Brevundimonas intermedia]|uniref:YcxB family protein n=1 Tax=Brevundimonas intermedia TaxID=74315 RepID=A0A4Y9RZN3_9CAUL|nr:YcxB family protein [Brevundimonas intermedia]TFW14524.1 YcxB family protein [Brevundimonas intermedia]